MNRIKIVDVIDFLEEANIEFAFSGDRSTELTGFSSLNNYNKGTFTWVKNQGNIPDGFDTEKITLAITSEMVEGKFQNVIRTNESKRAFFSTIEFFYCNNDDKPPIGQSTYIGPNVKIGTNVKIGHNCTLDGDISIGNDTIIGNNVTIVNRVCIGNRCDIHSGVTLGHDGFSFTENHNNEKRMNRHFGGIIIGDDVYIAMNSVIERGIIDDTVIKSGVKIDCLCLIGHNSVIEENAALVGGTRVYGSVHIGENAYLAGPLVRNQCVIGNNSFVGLGAVVIKDVGDEEIVAGVPAKTMKNTK